MKKICFLILICGIVLCCNRDKSIVEKNINAPSGTIFKKMGIKKTFSIEFIGGGICMPSKNGYVVFEILGKEQMLKYYNSNGELKNSVSIHFGQGATDLLSISESFVQDDRLMLVDDNNYLKSIDPANLSITSIEKISNKIAGYRSKFSFGIHGGTDIEYFNGQTITSFSRIDFLKDQFYIVSYKGAFNDFKILHEVERPLHFLNDLKNRKKETVRDYFRLVYNYRNLAVDWKNNYIYLIGDYDKPEIIRMDINGKRLTKINLGIDSSDFVVDKSKLDVWYDWAVVDTPSRFKQNIKNIFKYPETAPVLRDVNIVGDWVLITSGKRNWDTFENKVFVYQSSNMEFIGSFYIPTGDWPSKLFGDILVTKRIIEKEDDFVFEVNCYRLEVL